MRTVILAGVRLGAVADSRIVDLRVHPDLANNLVDIVHAILAECPDHEHILLGSVDWWVRELVARRSELAPAIVPYPPLEVIERVTDKAEFSRLCAELDLPQPRTVVVRPGQELPPGLPEPMVVKAASSAEFNSVEFPGKRKVEFLPTTGALAAYLQRVDAAGFTGEFVVQEHLHGGDDAMAAVNAFYGPDGRPHFFVFGQVLLEEHTPNGLGNSVGQITGSAAAHPAIVGARRLLDHLGWVGFANLDLRRSEAGFAFLELNPRIGRSGYAVTAAGLNAAEYYVRAFVDGEGAPPEPVVPADEHLFTVVPVPLLIRYARAWRGKIRALRRAGAVTNPYYYRAETAPRRWAYVAAAMVNQFRKFARHHPSSRSRRGS